MSRQHTFVFADLAGFTALTEAHGDERAADIAMEFCAELNRLLPEDAEDLKMLGDSCLLRVGAAHDAIVLALSVSGELARRHGFPDVRIGMHTGPAAQRGRDWFGSTINIAARVAALAGPGDVLLTSATRDATGASQDVRFEHCGIHELRHVVTPIELYRAQSGTDDPSNCHWVVDPVCHMRLDASQAGTSLDHAGAKMYFCSSLCAGRFARSPDRYLRDATGTGRVQHRRPPS